MTSETEETVLDLEAIARELLANFNAYKESDLSHSSAHNIMVDYKLYAKLDAALSRAPGVEELGGSTRMTSPASRAQTPLSAGWQDISTAPKGKSFLVTGRWDDGSEWLNIGTSTQSGNIIFGIWDDDAEPTHWMPLPPVPPAESDLSGAQQSELTRLAQDEPASSGGEGEVVAWRFTSVHGYNAGWQYEERDPRDYRSDVASCEPLYLHPSPEMGEISREDIARIIMGFLMCQDDESWPIHDDGSPFDIADAILSKLKENGLSREELGGDQPVPVVRGQGPNPVLTDGPLSDGGRDGR